MWYVGGMVRVEREDLVRVMHCSNAGLEDKGGIQSDLPLNGCFGGSGLFLPHKTLPYHSC